MGRKRSFYSSPCGLQDARWKAQQHTEWSPETVESEGVGKRWNDLGGSGNAKITLQRVQSCIRAGELEEMQIPRSPSDLWSATLWLGICRFPRRNEVGLSLSRS